MSAQTSYLGVVKAVLLKDLRIELRSKETLATMGLFGLVMTFVFAFGFSADPATNRKVIPGALWTALLFGGTLGVGRTFAREAKDDAFSALILSPAPRSAILLAKMVVNLLLSLSIIALVAPLFAVMLQVDLTAELPGIAGLLFLGAAGFAAVGTPLAVMAVNARFAEVLLPMVVFPMVTPVLIGGVKGTSILLGTTFSADGIAGWVQGMVAFDVAFGVGALFLFEKMVTE